MALRAPLSPDMAAGRENRASTSTRWSTFCRAAIAATGTLLIEGVGGIMVPLDDQRTVLDWMVALNIPLLLVAGGYLGAISHTLTASTSSRRATHDRGAGRQRNARLDGADWPRPSTTLKRFAGSIPVVRAAAAAPTSTDRAFAEIAALL